MGRPGRRRDPCIVGGIPILPVIIRHTAGTADGQHAVGRQDPCQVLAAGAAVIGAVQVFNDGGAGNAGVRTGNGGIPVGALAAELYLPQRGAAAERIVAHGGDAAGDAHQIQRGAVTEGVVAHGGDALRDNGDRHLIPIGIPVGGAGPVGEVRHSSASLDGQQARFRRQRQLPPEAVGQGAALVQVPLRMELGLGGQGIFAARHLLPRVAVVPVVHVGQGGAAGEGVRTDGGQTDGQAVHRFQRGAAGEGLRADGEGAAVVNAEMDRADRFPRGVPRRGRRGGVVGHPAGGVGCRAADDQQARFGVQIPRQTVAAGAAVVGRGSDAGAVVAAADPGAVQGADGVIVGLSLLKGGIAEVGAGNTICQYRPYAAVHPAVDAVALGVGGRLPCDGNAVLAGRGIQQDHIIRHSIQSGGHAVFVAAKAESAVTDAADRVDIVHIPRRRGIGIAGARHGRGEARPALLIHGPAVDRVGRGVGRRLPCDGDAVRTGAGGGERHVGGDAAGDAGAVIAGAHGAAGRAAADGIGIGHARLRRTVSIADAVDGVGHDGPAVGACDLAVHGVGGGAVGVLPGDGDTVRTGAGGGERHVGRGLVDSGADAPAVIAKAHGAAIRGHAANRVGIGGPGRHGGVRIAGARHGFGDDGPAVGARGLAVHGVALGVGGRLPDNGNGGAGGRGRGQRHVGGNTGGHTGGVVVFAEHAVAAAAANGIGVGHARLRRAVGIAGAGDGIGHDSPVIGACDLAVDHIAVGAVGGLPGHHDLPPVDTRGDERYVIRGLGHGGGNAGAVIALAHGAAGGAAADRVGIGHTGSGRVVRIAGAADGTGHNGPAGALGPAVDHIGAGIQGRLPCDGDAAAGDPRAGERHVCRFPAGGGGDAGAVIAAAHGLAVRRHAADRVGIGRTGRCRGIHIAGAGDGAGDDGPAIGVGRFAVDHIGLGILRRLPCDGNAVGRGHRAGHCHVGRGLDGDGGRNACFVLGGTAVGAVHALHRIVVGDAGLHIGINVKRIGDPALQNLPLRRAGLSAIDCIACGAAVRIPGNTDHDIVVGRQNGPDPGDLSRYAGAVRGGERQLRTGIYGSCIVVQRVVDIAYPIAAAGRLAGSPPHKQVKPTVAVGDIHQIVPAVEAHRIPHMRTAGASGGQPRFHAAVPAVLFLRQVAEVLERLGIAFTDHIGAGIVVKDPQQFPRVIAVILAAGRCAVIGVVGTDVVLIGLQLLVVSLAAVGGYHRFCHTHRVRHIGNVGGILVGAAEIPRHLQADGVARGCKGPAQRLAEPIHFVGQIHHQRRYHSADRGCGQ